MEVVQPQKKQPISKLSGFSTLQNQAPKSQPFATINTNHSSTRAIKENLHCEMNKILCSNLGSEGKLQICEENVLKASKRVKWLQSELNSTVMKTSRLQEMICSGKDKIQEANSLLDTGSFSSNSISSDAGHVLEKLDVLCSCNKTLASLHLKMQILFSQLTASKNELLKDANLISVQSEKGTEYKGMTEEDAMGMEFRNRVIDNFVVSEQRSIHLALGNKQNGTAVNQTLLKESEKATSGLSLTEACLLRIEQDCIRDRESKKERVDAIHRHIWEKRAEMGSPMEDSLVHAETIDTLEKVGKLECRLQTLGHGHEALIRHSRILSTNFSHADANLQSKCLIVEYSKKQVCRRAADFDSVAKKLTMESRALKNMQSAYVTEERSINLQINDQECEANKMKESISLKNTEVKSHQKNLAEEAGSVCVLKENFKKVDSQISIAQKDLELSLVEFSSKLAALDELNILLVDSNRKAESVQLESEDALAQIASAEDFFQFFIGLKRENANSEKQYKEHLEFFDAMGLRNLAESPAEKVIGYLDFQLSDKINSLRKLEAEVDQKAIMKNLQYKKLGAEMEKRYQKLFEAKETSLKMAAKGNNEKGRKSMTQGLQHQNRIVNEKPIEIQCEKSDLNLKKTPKKAKSGKSKKLTEIPKATSPLCDKKKSSTNTLTRKKSKTKPSYEHVPKRKTKNKKLKHAKKPASKKKNDTWLEEDCFQFE